MAISKSALALIKRAKSMPVGAGNYWKPEKNGDSIYGKVIGLREVTGNFGPQMAASIKTDTATQIVTLSTVLSSLFTDAEVVIGDTVAIVYRGESVNKKNGQNPAKLFSLAVEGREYSIGGGNPAAAKRKNRKHVAK